MNSLFSGDFFRKKRAIQIDQKLAAFNKPYKLTLNQASCRLRMHSEAKKVVAEDLLKKLYKKKSLRNVEGGFVVQLTNPLSDATIIKPAKVSLGAEKFRDFIVDVEGNSVVNKDISEKNPMKFSVKSTATLRFARDTPLTPDKYTMKFTMLTEEYGELKFRIKDRIRE